MERFWWLLRWLPGQRPLNLLDVGCGECTEGEALLQAGVVLTGLDQDESAIRLARARLPMATFHCADAARWSPGGPKRFAAVLMRRPDLLAQPDRWRQVMAHLPRLTEPTATLVITTVDAGEAPVSIAWLESAGYQVLQRAMTGVDGEAMVVLARPPGSAQAAEPEPAAPRVLRWEEGEALACDLATGACIGSPGEGGIT